MKEKFEEEIELQEIIFRIIEFFKKYKMNMLSYFFLFIILFSVSFILLLPEKVKYFTISLEKSQNLEKVFLEDSQIQELEKKITEDYSQIEKLRFELSEKISFESQKKYYAKIDFEKLISSQYPEIIKNMDYKARGIIDKKSVIDSRKNKIEKSISTVKLTSVMMILFLSLFFSLVVTMIFDFFKKYKKWENQKNKK